MNNLNPKITKLVRFLRAHGFHTVDSGDGQTHDYECDRDHAYVSMLCVERMLVSECLRLKELLASVGVETKPLDEGMTVPNIQGSFDPAWGNGVIDLINVTDDDVDWTKAEGP